MLLRVETLICTPFIQHHSPFKLVQCPTCNNVKCTVQSFALNVSQPKQCAVIFTKVKIMLCKPNTAFVVLKVQFSIILILNLIYLIMKLFYLFDVLICEAIVFVSQQFTLWQLNNTSLSLVILNCFWQLFDQKPLVYCKEWKCTTTATTTHFGHCCPFYKFESLYVI